MILDVVTSVYVMRAEGLSGEALLVAPCVNGTFTVSSLGGVVQLTYTGVNGGETLQGFFERWNPLCFAPENLMRFCVHLQQFIGNPKRMAIGLRWDAGSFGICVIHPVSKREYVQPVLSGAAPSEGVAAQALVLMAQT